MDVCHKFSQALFKRAPLIKVTTLTLVPKKSPQCHNSSGSTLWKKCHLFATYGLTYLCRYVHPNGRASLSQRALPGNRILLLLSWWTCMLIAAFQLASPKPGHETLKEIETSYKTSRDTTFGRRELEIRTEAKLQCGKAQKKIFSSKVSYFKSYARARAKWQSSIKYDLHFYLEKLLPKRNAFLSSWLSLWEEEKISLGKTTSTPDWTKKKIPKRILWRAKKREILARCLHSTERKNSS